VNVAKNGREETDDAPRSGVPSSATDERHVEQVTSVFERTRSISSTANATEVGMLTANVYLSSPIAWGKRKVCAKWNPHMLNDGHRYMRVLLATTHLQHWRN
jgi:hypothetical protein